MANIGTPSVRGVYTPPERLAIAEGHSGHSCHSGHSGHSGHSFLVPGSGRSVRGLAAEDDLSRVLTDDQRIICRNRVTVKTRR